ncbi:MAG TPA: CBS domain-containing protein [Caulobacteraceae bacterium]|jgi:CBS domain-containing protein|nr:CBS domain-containing protein [Caulobacteraceae bacterium]
MRLFEILRDKPFRLIALPPTATALEAASVMKAEHVGAVLVLDDVNRLLGLVSERELVLGMAADGVALLRRRVSEVMSVGGPTARPNDSVTHVMRTMTERRARHVPVLDGDAVVGVVSIGDVLKARLAEKVEENAVLQELARLRFAA